MTTEKKDSELQKSMSAENMTEDKTQKTGSDTPPAKELKADKAELGEYDLLVLLPSGKKARVKKGKGRDLFKAQMMATSPEMGNYALIALLVEYDGQKLTVEDLEDMDVGDMVSLLPLCGLPTVNPQILSST